MLKLMTRPGYDVIPGIHGDLARLEATLSALGAWRVSGTWRMPAGRRAAFLGDFTDGGRGSAAVLDTVRGMGASGEAVAAMGNHELNAILYHSEGENADGDGGGGGQAGDISEAEAGAAMRFVHSVRIGRNA